MRVLTVIDSLAVGGAEQSLSMITPHLVARDVDVHVAFLTDRPGIQDELRAGGATLHSLSGHPGWFRSVIRTVRLMRALRPDLVSTTLFMADIVARPAAWLLRIPVVSSFVTESYGPEHVFNPEYRPWKVRAAQLADALTARFVTRFHAVSEMSATVMAKRLWVPVRKIEVITRGRDSERLGTRTDTRRNRTRAELGIDDEAPLVLAAARHYHLKGLDVLIAAFSEVVADMPNALLFIAGRSGPATPELEELIAEHHLDSSVSLIGYRSDVADLMCAADVFVLPSRVEGSPGALIEAMALEVPTVASDIPSVRELVGSSYEIAVLSPVGSSAEMARAIIDLIEHPTRAAAMAAIGRQRYVDRYAMDAIADATVALYRACLNPALAAAGGSWPLHSGILSPSRFSTLAMRGAKNSSSRRRMASSSTGGRAVRRVFRRATKRWAGEGRRRDKSRTRSDRKVTKGLTRAPRCSGTNEGSTPRKRHRSR